MADRNVMVSVTMKHSEVAESRALVTGLEIFAATMFNYVNECGACIERGTPEDGARLGELLREMQAAAIGAGQAQARLHEIFGEAMISDPEGRQGRLQ